jgi:type VI protein secretion system component VasK
MYHNIHSTQPHILTFHSGRSTMHRRRHSPALKQAGVMSRKRDWERGSGWGFFLAGVGLLLAIVLGGVFYITQVTGSAMEGQDITLLERKVENLRDTQRRLELEATELQSLHRVQDRVERLNMAAPTDIAFTSPVTSGTTAMSFSEF